MVFHQNILYTKRDPLGNTQPRAVRKLEHRAIAKGKRLIQRWSLQELLRFFDRQHFGKRAPALRCLETLARVPHKLAFGKHESEIAPYRRHVSSDRCGRQAEILQVIHILSKDFCACARWRRRAFGCTKRCEPREAFSSSVFTITSQWK